MYHSLDLRVETRPSWLAVTRGLWTTLCLIGLWLCTSCGSSNGTTVIVNVSGVPTGVQLLRYVATMNGSPVRDAQELPPTAIEVTFALPEGASGDFFVEVRGIGGDGCAQGIGSGDLMIAAAGDKHVSVSVSLQPRNPAVCPVEVHTTGTGTISSNPTGLLCGQRCIVDVPAGSEIVLSATPGGRAYFSGWTGACAGYGLCTLTVDRPISVGAAFYAELCNGSNVCWESPLPAGIDLFGVYGLSTSDLWAVGESGNLLHYNGSAWALGNSPTTQILHGVWGSSTNDVYAVGNAGTLLHYDGNAWTTITPPSGPTGLNAIAGSSASDIWVVGNAGTILHYDGTWTQQPSGVVYDLTGVYASAGLVMVTGSGGQVLQRSGMTFVSVGTNTAALRAIGGASDSSVLAVGDSGTVQRWDGSMLSRQTGYPGPYQLRGISSRSTDEAWIAGSEGALLRWNGQGLARLNVPTSQALEAVYAIAKDDVWAVGDRGTLAHFDGKSVSTYGSSGVPDTSDFRAVSASGANDLWAVGLNNTIVHNNGQGWVPVPSGQPSSVNWRGVYAASPNEVWVVGNNTVNSLSVVLRWNGTLFTPIAAPSTTNLLNGVSGSGPSNIWIAGNGGTIYRWNGSAFSAYSAATPLIPQINTVAVVSPTEVWFGCAPTQDTIMPTTVGCVLHWNGTNVTLVRGIPIVTLLGSSVAASNDIWFAGYNQNVPSKGIAVRIQNAALGSFHDFGLNYPDMYAVSVRSGGDVWVSGIVGTILHATDGNNFSQVPTSLPITVLYGLTPAGDSSMAVVGSKRTILRILQ